MRVQGEGIEEQTVPLPKLPPNAVYVSHSNLCYDWGTFGWVLQTGVVDTSKYKHIVFMNSSSRGPFLPAYWPVCTHTVPVPLQLCALQLMAASYLIISSFIMSVCASTWDVCSPLCYRW